MYLYLNTIKTLKSISYSYTCMCKCCRIYNYSCRLFKICLLKLVHYGTLVITLKAFHIHAKLFCLFINHFQKIAVVLVSINFLISYSEEIHIHTVYHQNFHCILSLSFSINNTFTFSIISLSTLTLFHISKLATP